MTVPYEKAMERKFDMSIGWDCHPDCPHMYECIVYGMRCNSNIIPNFAILDEVLEDEEFIKEWTSIDRKKRLILLPHLVKYQKSR